MFQQIPITSVSSHFMQFILKICQTVAGTGMSGQFHEFFKSDFYRVFSYLAQLNIEGTAWFVKHQAIIWGLLHSICMFQVINPNRAVGNGDGAVPPPQQFLFETLTK